jgi:hypothetical protein
VLLDANPLDDIKNTQRIAAVVTRSRLLDHTALRKLLAEVQQRSRRTNCLMLVSTLLNFGVLGFHCALIAS